MNRSNELRVFISSTFRDLQNEREHLVKKIFPEIRALCRERGIAFTEIDLRWGLTDEQSALGSVIGTCLEEIDRCRPYFIGIVGNRYGWAPAFHEVAMDPNLFARYPWIEEAALEETSITEMEFIHGLFHAGSTDHSPGQTDGESVYFYRREGEHADIDDPERLQRMIDRASFSGHPMRSYDTAESLGQMVRDDLLKIIERCWPDTEPPSPLEVEQRAHAAFSASRRRAYIVQPEHLKFFNRWVAARDTPLVISAESGLGKSSLVAFLAEQHKRRNPSAFVIEHYVGASQSSGTAVAVIRHIIEEIRSRFSITDDVPSKGEELIQRFPGWLFRAERRCAEAGIDMLIVIDAVNQLDEAGPLLAWLPSQIPEGIRLIISTTLTDSHARLQERNWTELELRSLSDQRVRASIIVRYLSEFRKHVSAHQLERITSDDKASSPLFLRVVAEELRLHGDHETLDQAIEHVRVATDLEDVFQRVLERLEEDFGRELIESILSLLWASRGGLSETELLETSGARRLDLSRILFALDFHLIQQNGLLGFFHDYLRQAVERRYLSDTERLRHTRKSLARYFETQTVSIRVATELFSQYSALTDDSSLARFAACPQVISLWEVGEGQWELLSTWARLIARGYDPEQLCRESIEAWSGDASPSELADVLFKTGRLLKSMGRLDYAIEVFERLVVLGQQHGDDTWELRGEFTVGQAFANRAEYARGMEHLMRAHDVAERAGDRRAAALSIGSMGTIHFYQGRNDEAMHCFQQQADICTELGLEGSAASAYGNLGNTYASSGRYDEALECYERYRTVSERYGNLAGVANAVGNIGGVQMRLGRVEDGIASYKRSIEICESIGDRAGVTYACGNISDALSQLGRFEEGREFSERQHRLGTEMGDRRAVAIATAHIAEADRYHGRYAGALKGYLFALSENKDLGVRYFVATLAGDIAHTLLHTLDMEGDDVAEMRRLLGLSPDEPWRVAALRVARGYAEEEQKISVEVSGPRLAYASRVTLARIDMEEGNMDQAIDQLLHMLDETASNVDGIIDESSFQQAEIHYWLWKFGAPDAPHHHRTSLAWFSNAAESVGSVRFRRRLADLQQHTPDGSP